MTQQRERRRRHEPNYSGPYRRRDDSKKKRHRRGAARQRLSVSPGRWLHYHRFAFAAAVKRLRTSPWASLLTMIVLGVALSLPAALKVINDNTTRLGGGLDNKAQLSLFLKPEVSDNQGRRMAEQLAGRSDVRSSQFIDKQQALAEFRELSGFGPSLDQLDSNPLPAVIVIYPELSQLDRQGIEVLRDSLGRLPEVELAQLDSRWLERLFALIRVIERASLVITLFLIFAVVLLVGNTIRLQSEKHRPEIEVAKLVGATDGFVRRPFLYMGLLLGMIAAIIAWFFVTLAMAILATPLQELTLLYHDSYQFTGLSAADIGRLFATGMLLGFGGAWLAVSRFIHETRL